MVLEKAATIVGHRFTNERLLTAALTHASSADHRLESNERLEFLGDAILGYVVCEHLFRTYPDLLEGELTKIKSAVVSRKICAQISEKLDLGSLLNVGKGIGGKPGIPPSVAAAVLESMIAAIYLDAGIDVVRAFILREFEPHIHVAASSSHQQNFKSLLQQHAQRYMPTNPMYLLLDEKGPDHAKCFEVCVEIEGRRFPSAWANSKKEAEQKAALLALADLGVVTIDGDAITVNADGESAAE